MNYLESKVEEIKTRLDIEEIYNHNKFIKELIDKNKSKIPDYLIEIWNDYHLYIDTNKEYVVGSFQYNQIEEKKDRNEKAKLYFPELYYSHNLVGKLPIDEHYIKDGNLEVYFYTDTYSYELIDLKSLLIEYDDNIIRYNISESNQKDRLIHSYELCERLNIKLDDLEKIFRVYSLEFYFDYFKHYVKYINNSNETFDENIYNKKYSDKDILKLIEEYKLASKKKYIDGDEIISYPSYLTYADFLTANFKEYDNSEA